MTGSQADSPEQRLAALGLTLPSVAEPRGSYVAAVRTGDYVYVSGQVPRAEGQILPTGKVGADLTADEAAQLARICALNALAAVVSISGSLSKITRIVKVTGFVASAPDFGEQPKVVNGASDLLVEVLGEAGRHARSAVGMAALPQDVPVEVELIAEIRD
jgi:enamine deaminase RidA (YjgF/YER057c/UK114 family)